MTLSISDSLSKVYNNVTIIGEINNPDKDVILNGSNVKCRGGVIGRSVTAIKSSSLVITAEDDVKINKSLVGDVNSHHGKIEAISCATLKSLRALEGEISATNCGKLGMLAAKNSIFIKDCPHVDFANSKGSLNLENSNIIYSAESQGNLTIINSRVRKLEAFLSVNFAPPIIQFSTIGTLLIKKARKGSKNPVYRHSMSHGHVYARESKFVIELINSHVKEIFFERDTPGEVILDSNSSVGKVYHGIISQSLEKIACPPENNEHA